MRKKAENEAQILLKNVRKTTTPRRHIYQEILDFSVHRSGTMLHDSVSRLFENI